MCLPIWHKSWVSLAPNPGCRRGARDDRQRLGRAVRLRGSLPQAGALRAHAPATLGAWRVCCAPELIRLEDGIAVPKANQGIEHLERKRYQGARLARPMGLLALLHFDG